MYVLSVLLAKNLYPLMEVTCYRAIKIVLLLIVPCFRHIWWIHVSLMLPQSSVTLWLLKCWVPCLSMSAYVEKGKGWNQTSDEGSFTELEEAPSFLHVLLRPITRRWFLVTEDDFCILQAGQQFSLPLHTPAHDVADHWRVVIFFFSNFITASANFVLDTHL